MSGILDSGEAVNRVKAKRDAAFGHLKQFDIGIRLLRFGRRDSKASARKGGPDSTRTSDLLISDQLLDPAELQARWQKC
jgi:hypothetical protein